MNVVRVLLVVLLMSLWGQPLHAQKMSVSLRVNHGLTIDSPDGPEYYGNGTIFGGPLFVEVTIVNQGEKTITGPAPSFEHGTLQLQLCDTQRHVIRVYPPAEEKVDKIEAVQFEPGKPIKYLGYVFLPNLWQLEAKDPFWMPSGEPLETMNISAIYHLGPRIKVVGGSEERRLLPRNPEELQLLKQWTDLEGERAKGPIPSDFGIPHNGSGSPTWIFDLAAQPISGELDTLLALSLKMQQIYAASPESCDKKNRELLSLLFAQGDVEREVMTQKAIEVAKKYEMHVTAVMLENSRDR